MLQDGYYLFIYSEINPVLNVLKKSKRHDHCLSVFHKNNKDIKLVCHLEFERFSGIKHHNIAFFNKEDATKFINLLLEPYALSLDDFVGIYGLPGFINDAEDFSYSSISEIENISYHAICHLFTSLCIDTDKFYNNVILSFSFDGGPDSLIDKNIDEKYYFCGSISHCGKVEYFPIASPGGYWLYLSDYFDIPEGTLMALAYATKARSLEKFNPLSNYYKASDRVKFIQEIKCIIERIMSYTPSDEGVLYVTENETKFSDLEIKISMIVKIIQELSIDNVCKQIDQILSKKALIPSDIMISLSGGYALNCPTNTHIMNRYGFKEQLCAPCINDSGLSLGMGLYFFYKNCDFFKFCLHDAYYGYNDKKNILNTLKNFKHFIAEISQSTMQIAEDIRTAPIVWIDGNAEIGPRALGHRSILADPSNILHKNLLNKYKQREWWRPVAPIVMEEYISDWFINAFSSPYMLNNFDVNCFVSEQISGVLHLDGTARVQTVNRTDDINLWRVISDFFQLTGIPIISNTSLNDKGEPIINTVAQALNFALRKNIVIVYAYGYRIKLHNHKDYAEIKPMTRYKEPFISHQKERKDLITKINPHHLSETELLIYLFSPSMQKYDIKIHADAMVIRNLIKKLKIISEDLKFFET